MVKYVMVIDSDKCIGCHACTIACKTKNATPPGSQWCQIRSEESGIYPNVVVTNLPIQCMHCDHPACMEVCSSGSFTKNSNGIVTVDQSKCTGCEQCLQACPYNVLSIINIKPYSPEFGFNHFEEKNYTRHKDGVVGKCDFCQDLTTQGKKPACVNICPLHAREFGDLNEPDSEVSRIIQQRSVYRLHSEHGTEPSVYYLRNKS